MRNLQRRLLAGLVFGFVVVLGLVLLGDLQQIGNNLAGFRWGFVPLMLACTLFNYALRFLKWHYYLGRIGVSDFSPLRSLRLFVAGLPLAVTPGKVGEVLKGVWLHAETGIPSALGVTVVLAERISDGLAVLVLSTLGVIAYPRYWPAFASVLTVLLGLIVISQIRPLALTLIGWAEKLPFVGRYAHHLREFYEGAFLLFQPKTTFLAVFLGTIAWFGEGVAMYLVLTGLGAPPGWQTLSIAVFTLAFSIVIGAASALPGGLGASEASITGMLTLLMGLSTDVAAAATLLIRFSTLWFAVFLGLGVWAFSKDLLLAQSGHERLQEGGLP